MPPSAISIDDAGEIALAERQVAARKAELSQSLRRVGQSSEHLARKLGAELKPALAVAVAVAGAAAAVAVTVALVQRSRRRHQWLAPQGPSALATAAKTAGMWAVRILARRVAQELVTRLNAPSPSLVAASPDQVQG
jgi:DNA-binding phage protein